MIDELLYCDFYPRPPRGGRLRIPQPLVIGNTISIHALREEGDVLKEAGRVVQKLFLSTPSARRATAALAFLASLCKDFYPRPPRGGRLSSVGAARKSGEFLSTPSARRATRAVIETAQALKNFYPRPPRGGRPTSKVNRSVNHEHFYPRPPRGGRQDSAGKLNEAMKFLSTPSARRATGTQCVLTVCFGISIHALREEGDIVAADLGAPTTNFYPRPPRGGRRASLVALCNPIGISIHALREEGDRCRP